MLPNYKCVKVFEQWACFRDWLTKRFGQRSICDDITDQNHYSVHNTMNRCVVIGCVDLKFESEGRTRVESAVTVNVKPSKQWIFMWPFCRYTTAASHSSETKLLTLQEESTRYS